MKYGKNLSFLRGMGPTACSAIFYRKKVSKSLINVEKVLKVND
jgi:hypothetical protein